MTIVSDIEQSTNRVSSYWIALRTRALAKAGVEFDFCPTKSALWAKLVYGSDATADVKELLNVETEFLNELDLRDSAAFREKLGLREHPRLRYAGINDVATEMRAKLAAADLLIRDLWPLAFCEWREILHTVAWFTSQHGLTSTSDPKKFGIIHVNCEFYRSLSVPELATALLHESAHHALFIETAVDPLISKDAGKMIFSPLRGEMRPAIGVLHALFVSGRLIQWAHKLNEGPASAEAEVSRIQRLYQSDLDRIASALRDNGLTERGQQIVNEIISLPRISDPSPKNGVGIRFA